LRYFLHIAYSGTNYRGWQMQKGVVSVQEIIEKNLSQVFKKPVYVVGCGRTDAQVHASQYFLHFQLDDEWDFDLVFRLNKMLPPDISVFDLIPVEPKQHARFGAKKRTYDYFIHTYKDPFLRNISTLYTEFELDIPLMAKAVELLTKYDDYHAFCKTPASHSSTLCEVSSAQLYTNKEGNRIRFQITSNRFLRGMIRIIVGKLLQIGSGQMMIEEFEELLITKITPPEFDVAHPQGLFLSEVTYPFLEIPPKTSFSAFQQNGEWIKL
jgi:tRNA pseudouridine38-40 synthase